MIPTQEKPKTPRRSRMTSGRRLRHARQVAIINQGGLAETACTPCKLSGLPCYITIASLGARIHCCAMCVATSPGLCNWEGKPFDEARPKILDVGELQRHNVTCIIQIEPDMIVRRPAVEKVYFHEGVGGIFKATDRVKTERKSITTPVMDDKKSLANIREPVPAMRPPSTPSFDKDERKRTSSTPIRKQSLVWTDSWDMGNLESIYSLGQSDENASTMSATKITPRSSSFEESTQPTKKPRTSPEEGQRDIYVEPPKKVASSKDTSSQDIQRFSPPSPGPPRQTPRSATPYSSSRNKFLANYDEKPIRLPICRGWVYPDFYPLLRRHEYERRRQGHGSVPEPVSYPRSPEGYPQSPEGDWRFRRVRERL